MASFSVHLPKSPRQRNGSDVVLVRDAFSVGACLLSPLWFLWRRAWLGLFAWAAGLIAILALAWVGGLPPAAWGLIVFAFLVLIGLEGPTFWRAALARRGYATGDVAEGASREDAEAVFLVRHLAEAPREPMRSSGFERGQDRRNEAVGLFLEGNR